VLSLQPGDKVALSDIAAVKPRMLDDELEPTGNA
jgi:hypothetical protein